jgi:nucleoporin NDC1
MVIKKLEAFRLEFPLHWTDVSGKRVSPEVEKVIDALKVALQQVLAKFEPYSSDLRLTLGDMRLAKEACADAKKAEMAEVAR